MPSLTAAYSQQAIMSNRRPPISQEFHVMERYSGHASRCEICSHPVEVFSQGRNLCDRGIRHAHNFVLCIRQHDGKAYAADDIEYTPKEIQIPEQFPIINKLLLALDMGLQAKIRKPQPVVVFNSNEQSSKPRIENSPPSPPSPSASLPERSTSRTLVITNPRKSKRHASDDLSLSSRGSLYPAETDNQQQVVVHTFHSGPKSHVRIPSSYLK